MTNAPAFACCWWPIGALVLDFRFCAAPAVPGRLYCAEHLPLAYVLPPVAE